MTADPSLDTDSLAADAAGAAEEQHDLAEQRGWRDAPDDPAARVPGERWPEMVLERLNHIDEALVEFHRRADHREKVIDRLHDENQRLRAGQSRAALDPIIVDLIRLFDGLSQQADWLAGQDQRKMSDLFGGFADDVELSLERCGLEVYRPQAGEEFRAGRHAATETLWTDDPRLHNTVANTTHQGIVERETGRFRRPARVRVFRYTPPEETGES